MESSNIHFYLICKDLSKNNHYKIRTIFNNKDYYIIILRLPKLKIRHFTSRNFITIKDKYRKNNINDS